jgi:hypothetical protein
METLDSKIQYYEQKLKKIPKEYNTSMSCEYNTFMSCEWPAIPEKEVYFIRNLAKLKKISEDTGRMHSTP